MIAQHPQLYKCSIAAGSVVEWELYDSVNLIMQKSLLAFRPILNATWADR
jgi:hypothetical protein